MGDNNLQRKEIVNSGPPTIRSGHRVARWPPGLYNWSRTLYTNVC